MTTPSPSNCAEGLLIAALDHASEDRETFLANACGDDAALLAEVREMLAAHEAMPTGFLDEPAADQMATIKVNVGNLMAASGMPLAEQPGDMIGPYKLREQIGEGGFGTVWVADQEKPVRRRVALKVIKLGMDTKEVITRFEQERQALAMMDHANIAKVLDAGTTQTGRPYFVMELVRGVKITDFCDEKGLSTRERTELFIQVCNAVQHAHQKGIIHRDLKPSNILVTINDGVAVPKVIDFGVAKATQGRLTDGTIYTQFQQMIGTPLYMSPEQAEMTSLDVDTRSDIYSLGVLLYELLTGRTPIDMKTMAQAGMDEIRRLIREVDPPRPSARIKTLDGNELTTMAKRRHTEAAKLPASLRGDLDWIVMKCLEKDRARRYDTANGLALDLQRHLKNEVVVARPPTTAYLLGKLIKRNKLAFAAGVAIAASLVIGIAASLWQAVRARSAEHQAVAAFDELRATAPAFAEQARALAAREQYSEAVEKLDYAIKLRPEAAEFLVQKADLLQCQFKLTEAVAIYRAALALQPDHARAEASVKLCDELLVAPTGPDGKLTRESLGKLRLAMLKQQRPAAELLPVARLLDAEKEHLVAYWLERLKDLSISAERPLTDRLTVREDGLLELDLKDTQITDLAPLVGMPLGKLVLWNCTQIADFRPLSEFRLLTHLDLDGTQIADLSVLRGLPLELLSIGGTAVSDLSPLRGMKLKTLGLYRCRNIFSLSPLEGMPLTELYIVALSHGTDFSPLKDLPLEKCAIGAPYITDLSFLAGCPLKELGLFMCESLRGLAWLNEIKSLERLILPWNYRTLPDEDLQAIAALRGHPRLAFLQESKGASEYETWRLFQVTQSKDIFWRDWDREQTFLPAIRRSGFNLSLRKLADGTYQLFGDHLPISDLSFLKGAPISQLILPGCRIEDIAPIRGLPLKELWLNGNPITDLAPLRGSAMPIEKLGLSGGTFRDLTPLAGLPLKEVHLHRCPGVADVAVLAQIPTLERITVPALARSIESLRALPRLQLLSFSLTTSFPWIPDTTTGDFWEEWPKLGWLHALHQSGFKPVDLARLPDHTWEVDLDNTAIRDLSILVGAPVSKLGLQGTRVTDLEPLRGMPLRQLRLHGAKIASLEPLRGMGLDELVISGTLVTDLSPLLGMPLAKLHLGGAPVADLSPLRGMPLAEVKMAWCSQITDLSPLSESLTLENLTLPPNARDIEFLRRITTIRHISFTEHSSTYLPDKTAGRFWREYEERHQFRALPGTADRRRKLADGTWELDLSDLDFSDLSLVAALPVSSLNLTRTKITSLDPLRGMKLNKLVLSETAIADLGPLADMPLTVLNLRGCARLRDLSPLQRCRSLKSLIVPLNAQNIELLRALHLVRIGYKDTPVKGGLHGLPAAEFWADLDANPWQTALRKAGILFRRLEKLADGTWDADFERTGIRGLKLLQGAPISMLRIGGTQVTDLSPLRDMSLTHLAIYNTQVADIGPLQGMPLVQLHASSTPVKDISVLRGMPLRQVRLHHCSHLTDVSPLAGCADLTDLTLPPNAANYEFLRDPARFPRLTHLSFEENPAQSGLRQPKHTVAEFWKSYDARKKP